MPRPQPQRRGGSWLALRKSLGFLGPGLLAMAGDNDAGGLLSYLATGSTHGAGFFLLLLFPLVAMTYMVQEMSLRLGLIGGRSFLAFIRTEFGRTWSAFALGDLWLFNIVTLVTEFAGMGEGLRRFGVSLAVGIPLSFLLLALLTLTGQYRRVERTTIVLALFNLAFLPLALWHHPHWPTVLAVRQTTGPSFVFFVIAMVGNALAPWMIFFQTEAVLEKKMTIRELALGRLDLLAGSLVQSAVAAALLLLGSGFPAHSFALPAFLDHLDSSLGPWASRLVALGLFDAGFVAAITISFSSAWTVTQGFGWSRHRRPGPAFYAVYLGSALIAAAIVLIPKAPLAYLAVGAQALSALLLPPLLLFLLLLTRDRRILGKWRNSPRQNFFGLVVLAVFLGTAAALLI